MSITINIILILIIIIIILFLIKTKYSHNYKTAILLPGNTIFPFFGDTIGFVGKSPLEIFNCLRESAIKFNASYRFYVFDALHFNVIRARDLEVVYNLLKYI